MPHDTASESALYAAVLAQPSDDSPRLALADDIEQADPIRADFIRRQVRAVRAEATAITNAQESSPTTEQLQEAWALAQHRTHMWIGGKPFDQLQSHSVAHRGFVRGFMEHLSVGGARPAVDVEATLAAYPILHLHLSLDPFWRAGTRGERPLITELTPHFPSLLTLQAYGVTDDEFRTWLETGLLDGLRYLRVQGEHVSRTSLERLCERPPPRLEHLELISREFPEPSEHRASSNDWSNMSYLEYAVRSSYGEELERRYGFRKFLHAASRFSIHPCWPGAFDVLPDLPDHLQVRRREWGP